MSHSYQWNLLVLSDLHLGDQLPGEARERVRANAEFLSRHFGAFLEHYTEHRVSGRPWRLLIAGDMIDFMRIHVPDDTTARTAHSAKDSFTYPSQEPAQSSQLNWKLPPFNLEGALRKLDQVFTLHRRTFELLSRFILRGNEVLMITGNHDAEFNWIEVQEAFREQLIQLAMHQEPGLHPESFFRRVRFLPWFYYEPGRIYVEHGHLYDRYCNIENFLALESAAPKDEELLSFSHFATRYQYRSEEAFSGLPLEHLDQWTFFQLVRWVLSRPLRQQYLLVIQFLGLFWSLLSTAWSARYRKATALPPDKRQQVFREIAHRQGLPVEAIEPLQQYVPSPIHANFFDTIQALYLDRMALVIVTAMLIMLGIVAPWSPALRAGLLTLTATGFVFAYIKLAARHPVAHAAPALVDAAGRIASHLQTPLVVFGHSHKFERTWLSQTQLYVNLGSWIPPADPTMERGEASESTALPNTPPCTIPSASPHQTPYLQITYDDTTSPPKDRVQVGYWSAHERHPTLEPLSS